MLKLQHPYGRQPLRFHCVELDRKMFHAGIQHDAQGYRDPLGHAQHNIELFPFYLLSDLPGPENVGVNAFLKFTNEFVDMHTRRVIIHILGRQRFGQFKIFDTITLPRLEFLHEVFRLPAGGHNQCLHGWLLSG